MTDKKKEVRMFTLGSVSDEDANLFQGLSRVFTADFADYELLDKIEKISVELEPHILRYRKLKGKLQKSILPEGKTKGTLGVIPGSKEAIEYFKQLGELFAEEIKWKSSKITITDTQAKNANLVLNRNMRKTMQHIFVVKVEKGK